MRRFAILAAAVAAVTPAATGLAAAAPNTMKLQLRPTNVGKILVDQRGFTIYAFTKDGRGKDRCTTIGGCSSIWPLLTTSGKPSAGPGVKSSLIGTITLKGGARQVTYAGHPLYGYAADGGPGSTEYVNVSQFGGRWPALNAAGQQVK